MAKKDDGGPAFPGPMMPDVYLGMSLRDYFAGQALAAAFHDSAFEPDEHYKALAQQIWLMADAMLEARK